MYIFVYGTLKKAYRDLNAFTSLFHAGTEWLANDVVKGDLFLKDWYPALKLGGENLAHGEIYRIHAPALLQNIDQYEDAITEEQYHAKLQNNEPVICEYVRKRIHINNIECWIYEYIQEVNPNMRIATGVFKMN